MEKEAKIVLGDIKVELKKLIEDAKKYPDCGKPYLTAYRNVLAMISYAERGELDQVVVHNCLHRKYQPIYGEVQ